ncbi:unnamed protein product [Cylicocyclus nassatus]|uniref:Uncharacterized protein n=1 Tax=Cylicocyclus nassatus TaxID=53992 RepID=A0AA36GW06_CYLNA|nr:unnamed protein product [Cylicocyclus nassatus]
MWVDVLRPYVAQTPDNSTAVLFVALHLFVHFVHGYSLRCYSCSIDFHKQQYYEDTRDGQCADKAFLLRDEDDTVKSCAPWETYCVTSVVAVHSSLATVSRGCTEYCSEECRASGYVADQICL